MNKSYKTLVVFLVFTTIIFAQQNETETYKKRVLETTEVDFLTSYYTQEGDNAAVTGGIGNEHLTDFTPTFVVSVPLNDDDVLTIDAGVSAYSSASSSNLNPFNFGGEEVDISEMAPSNIIGSPWVASSGASKSDLWAGISGDYSHSSPDRNTIWNADVSFASEYDYFSIGFGGGITKLFNEKNTTINVSTKIYLDSWKPEFPIELKWHTYVDGDLNAGVFRDVPIYNQNGIAIDKSGATGSVWSPDRYQGISNKSRNSYSISFSFSQILSKNAQASLFFDIVKQDGWLGNPMQRVYFSDIDNFYLGNASNIPNYRSSSNNDVFQLADDIERLPNSRFKIPIGLSFNYYINETFTLRTYYRYYYDDWGINSHTANIEIPIKINSKFTLYPSYRYYNQTAADYFEPFEEHVSTERYYTSDYDLSKFSANQYGFGISYADIFAKWHIKNFGLKNIDLKYNNYERNSGLTANIISLGFKFAMD